MATLRRGGPGLAVVSGQAAGRWAVACWALADGLDALKALAQGVPVPRSRLKREALALIDQPATGPDYALTPEDAIRLALHGGSGRNGPAPESPVPGPWLERAADLLAEADPGPTPFLVEELLVDGALGAVQGQPKTWKTWLELELARAIVTGTPALGRFAVPDPGPVVLVLEESGRAALHRRLGTLARGTATRPAALADLHFAANRRVRLDDLEWQQRLQAAVEAIEPRAVFLDPLARLKSAGRNENAQDEMALLLDVMRQLRDEAPSRCAVVFVHHEGHAGGHLRGSSDLESYWESKLAVRRDGDEAILTSEHREAEAGAEHRFRLAWDGETSSVRLRLTEDDRQLEIVAAAAEYLDDHPNASANEVYAALGGRKQDVFRAVAHLRDEVVPADREPPGTTPAAKAPMVVPEEGAVSLETDPDGTTGDRGGSRGAEEEGR